MNFYPAPEVVTAQVYCTIPPSLRCNQEKSDWTEHFYRQLDGVFLEGPVVDEAGNLYVVDVPYGRIIKIDGGSQRTATVCVRWDGEPNGLAILHDGRMVVADYKNGLLIYDPTEKTVKPFLTRCNMERFKGVNDLLVDSKGIIYFTDQGQTGMTDQTGRVFQYNPHEDQLTCLLSNGASPNGLVLSPDEKVLYVAMTRSNQVWQLPLRSLPITKVAVFFQGFGPVGPDGLTVDSEGNIFICMPGLGRVFVVDRVGVPLKSIQGPLVKTFITNITFGGPENKTLFMTDSLNGVVLSMQWHCSGVKRG